MRGLGADAPYWEALKQNRLKLQVCKNCRKWNWPAVYRCGDCGSWEHDWLPVDMSGEIFTWTRSWHDFGAPESLGLPFVTVVVALDGANSTRLVGVFDTEGDAKNCEVAIGQRVKGNIITVIFGDETIPVIQWRLVDDNVLTETNDGEGR